MLKKTMCTQYIKETVFAEGIQSIMIVAVPAWGRRCVLEPTLGLQDPYFFCAPLGLLVVSAQFHMRLLVSYQTPLDIMAMELKRIYD